VDGPVSLINHLKLKIDSIKRPLRNERHLWNITVLLP